MPDAQTDRKLTLQHLGAFLIGALVVLVLAAFVLWPQMDLFVSGLFYTPNGAFFMRDTMLFNILHLIAYSGARVLGFLFFILIIVAGVKKGPVIGLDKKAWLFLLLGLVLGPALVANIIFKDHWGRARPREVTEFGGMASFTPPLLPANECRHNCSFVSGDGAFGFFLPVFAYVVSKPRSRRYFWGGMGLGCLFGLARIAAGAHFLSDVLFAAFFVQITIAFLSMLMYGKKNTFAHWCDWLFLTSKRDEKARAGK